jgi:hypothetical protein
MTAKHLTGGREPVRNFPARLRKDRFVEKRLTFHKFHSAIASPSRNG